MQQSDYAAKAHLDAAIDSCLDKLHKTDAYKAAAAELDAAITDKEHATGDAKTAAAVRLVEASNAVRKLEKAALDADPDVAQAAKALATLPPLNLAVLQFAQQREGKIEGNGECWTLAANALAAAHARQVDVYVFGRELDAKEAAFPGDIIQFTSARFVGPRRTISLGFPNHTAIIKQVISPDSLVILAQHPGPVKPVTINFKFLVSGSYKIYRPVADDDQPSSNAPDAVSSN